MRKEKEEEERYRSPYYYDMDPIEKLVHDNASPYMAEDMYWSRKNMEMSNMYRRDEEDHGYYRGNSTSGGDRKLGLIVSLAILMYFFLMMLALSSLLNNHY
jgi:hypothetical protein